MYFDGRGPDLQQERDAAADPKVDRVVRVGTCDQPVEDALKALVAMP